MDIQKPNCKILKFDSLPSTNDTAKRVALEGAGEYTVIIAEHQTAGRGRLSRRFYSPTGTGLYMSVILKPQISATDIPLITTAAATATAEAIENLFGLSPLIKWVNDIYLSGKKVCGILCESGGIGNDFYCILGIGVNITRPSGGFPSDIENIAGALFENKPDIGIKDRLANEIINCFHKYYVNLSAREFIGGYKKRSFLLGKEVTFEKGGVSVTATVTDIDESARLILDSEGDRITLGAGEVSVKLK